MLFLLSLAVFSSVFGNPKIVLLNDTSNWYHWGCTGTSIALKEGIQKIGFEIQAIPINVTYALKKVPQFEEFGDRQKFDQFCEENKETVHAIQAADVVVITGEGTIHDLRAGPRALLYLAYVSREFLGKHVEIVNHSAYPKDDPVLSACFLENFGPEKENAEKELKWAQEVYKTLYSKLNFVAIREPFSRDTMEKMGISSTLSFDCLPLYIRDHYHIPKQIKGKTVVLAGSVAFTEAGAEQICRYLERMEGMGFKTKVLVGAAAFPAKDDQKFVDFLKAHCQAHWDLISASSIEEWLNTINHANLLVSGRFHHSIAAFCLNTPFIALNSNTHKVHAICSLLGHVEPLLFSDPELSNQLVCQTEILISSPAPNNKTKISEICELAERNFDGIKAFLETFE